MTMSKFFLIYSLFFASTGFSQNAETIQLEGLKELMSAKTDKIQIINFWATWCGPCVKELPLFEKLHAAGRDNIKVTLVSLDLDLDPDPGKVYKFIARRNLRAEVLLLDAPDPNSWINQIDRAWTGALPATLIINQKTGKRKFIGNELSEGDLEEHIKAIQ